MGRAGLGSALVHFRCSRVVCDLEWPNPRLGPRRSELRRLYLVRDARPAVHLGALGDRGRVRDPRGPAAQRHCAEERVRRGAQLPPELLAMRILRPVLWTIAACLVAGVLGAVFLIWGPSRRQRTAPAPHAIYVRSLGESGPGKVQRPIGVAVAASGEVFVSSSGDSRIVVFGTDGAFRRSFGREGDGPSELQRPMHLSIGPDGLLDVPEYLNDRISIFRQDGSFVSHLAPKGLDAPGAVVVAADGTIYVANFYHHEVSRFSSQGKPLESWGTPGRIGHGRLHYPTDLAFAPAVYPLRPA